MAARAMWKGVVQFADVRLPVKMYAAVEDRDIHFRLLHEADAQPVVQRMVHPSSGKVVPPDEVLRGIETDDGALRIVEEEELERLRPEPSRDIEITRFVPRQAIPEGWYDRPYYLGPDGDPTGYFALAAALQERARAGVARWTMRGKRYVGALTPEAGYLTLPTLRFAGEVVASEELGAPSGRELSRRELEMAEQLVSMLEDDFQPEAFRNRHRDRLRELIEAKARGEVVPLRPRRRRKPTEDLSAALKRSLERAKAEKRRAS
ncbi:MAG TPA: Ku protein [Longimicrobiales bacterium]|nr:Ku protein [Longimicrobiales bacterium]